MSVPPPPCDVMPEPTPPVVRAAFRQGNASRRRRDALGPMSMHPPVATRFSPTGRPAEAPTQLALITRMPCAAGLSEAQAAAAVRARLDWPDALALAWTDPGGAAAVLRAVRQRRLTGQAARLRFETRRTRCREQGWLTAKGRQRTDATPVLAALQTRKRLAGRGDTRRQALQVLATVAPDGRQAWGARGVV
jgi:transposase